ncbi:MAG: hypothetical protein WD068_00880 [Candidatus Babeliales bacterium]
MKRIVLIAFFSIHCMTLQAEATACPTWITIFVHGSIKPQFSLANIAKIARDNLPHSTCWLGTEIIRNDPYFYQNQAIQALGLHPIDTSHEKEGYAAGSFAHIYEKLCSLNCPTQVNNRYYTYGWSGLLSHKSRYQDAKQFYDSLSKELKKLALQGLNPKVRIIGYSHGGNIGINLAEVRKNEYPNDTFTIDEIYLIGTPIQPLTMECAQHSIFGHIYHFYSHGDWVQKLDSHAQRKFDSFNDFDKKKMPNITQIKMKVYKRYAPPGKAHILPKKINPKTQRRIDPGHMELWFFGWTIYWYRENFPLNPLPMGVLLGWITQLIKQVSPDMDDISFGIFPELNMVTIKSEQRHEQKRTRRCSFLSPTQFQELRTIAHEYRPDPAYFNKAAYKSRKRMAYYQAHVYDKAYQREKKRNLHERDLN